MAQKKTPTPAEKAFEKILWSTRYVVLIGVIAGVIGAFALFIYGTIDMLTIISENPVGGHKSSNTVMGGIVGTIDLYLIGIVALLFSFGTYELFISKIDIAREDDETNILEIKDLDQLKNKILKVIVMVLVVSFFKQILEMKFSTPLEMLYFAVSILFLSVAAFFLKKE